MTACTCFPDDKGRHLTNCPSFDVLVGPGEARAKVTIDAPYPYPIRNDPPVLQQAGERLFGPEWTALNERVTRQARLAGLLEIPNNVRDIITDLAWDLCAERQRSLALDRLVQHLGVCEACARGVCLDGSLLRQIVLAARPPRSIPSDTD